MKDLATIHAAGIAAAIKTTTASETFLGAVRAAAKHLKTAAALQRLEAAGPKTDTQEIVLFKPAQANLHGGGGRGLGPMQVGCGLHGGGGGGWKAMQVQLKSC